MIRPPRAHPRDRRGVAAVEFALILPFLMVLVLGMIEIGRAIIVKEALSDAAQMGCRTAALPGKTSSDVMGHIATVMSDNGLTGYTVTVQVNGTNANASAAKRNDKLTVRVSIPISQVFWVSTTFLRPTATVSATVHMMRQG